MSVRSAVAFWKVTGIVADWRAADGAIE